MTLVDAGIALFRWRNTLFPLALTLVFLPGPQVSGDPLLALAAGAVCAALGQLVRILAIGLKYIVRGGRNRRIYADDLVVEGLYAHTRNPMYVGNLLIIAGIAIASNSWTCLLIVVPLFALAYHAIVAAEERYLRDRFDAAFDVYAENVPRWGFRYRDFGQTLASIEFNWRRVLVKEYCTPLIWIAGLCLLGLIRVESPELAAAYPKMETVLWSILAASAILWAVARWLKKARIVVAN